MSALPRTAGEILAACSHLLTVTTRRTISNGSVQVVKQCTACGRAVGGALPHSSVPIVEALPAFDFALLDRGEASIRAHFAALRAQHAHERAERHTEYEAYLRTPEWQAKRRKALERDGHICQGCLTARATEVHHTTYSHLGAELMFQLISLCADCHEWLHSEDRSRG